jgi:N-acetyl-gamma-glutamyl-phosphate reductase
MDTAAQVRTAIIGASGYSGEELVRLLVQHPQALLTSITSRQYAGQTLAQVFPRFAHHPKAATLRFSEPKVDLVARQADVVFLALPHGVAAEYAEPLLNLGARVVDLSADFRLKSPAVYADFYGHDHPCPRLLDESIYGLPEIYRSQLRSAKLVAAPGCYPTSILLPLIPLLRAKLISSQGIIADSLSGVSGAGRKAELDYLFVECNESLRAYGLPKHRHLSEIEQELSSANASPVIIQFTPHLVPVNRGILTTLYLAPLEPCSSDTARTAFLHDLAACYRAAYQNEPFVRVLEGKQLPDTKNVVGTNVIEFGWRLDPRTGRLILVSAIDNLAKGASSQAVQCLNLMCGFPETAGLLG